MESTEAIASSNGSETMCIQTWSVIAIALKSIGLIATDGSIHSVGYNRQRVERENKEAVGSKIILYSVVLSAFGSEKTMKPLYRQLIYTQCSIEYLTTIGQNMEAIVNNTVTSVGSRNGKLLMNNFGIERIIMIDAREVAFANGVVYGACVHPMKGDSGCSIENTPSAIGNE
jgi:hypothetical protein